MEQAPKGEVGGLVEGLLRALEAERDRSKQAEHQVSTRLPMPRRLAADRSWV